MRAAGAEVWCSVFEDELVDGEEWSDQIYAALKRCSVFVLLVTDAQIDGMTKEESDFARNRYNKLKRPRVVSVRLSEAAELPERYESLQSVVLPADWQSETSDFITKKLRQWGEIAASAATPPSSEPKAAPVPAQQATVPAPALPQRDEFHAPPMRTAAPVSVAPLEYEGVGSSGVRERGSARRAPTVSRWPLGRVLLVVLPAWAFISWAAIWFSTPEYDVRARVDERHLEMVRISAGKFLMGGARHDDEKPPHEVTLAAYELAKTEVTRGQWREVMLIDPADANWSTDRSDERLPASSVTWDEARSFCEKLSDREGLTGDGRYRLPSESEWEYACRAGTTTEYWSGNSEQDLVRVGWYYENSGGRVQTVGEKPPNTWGLFDMHGNVLEWCEDTAHKDYNGAPSDGSAWVDEASSLRVIRGGSFVFTAVHARSAYRDWHPRSLRWDDVGFRPARSVTTD
jgi:formylglycine-generating enzyme required for sulfatase activity